MEVSVRRRFLRGSYQAEVIGLMKTVTLFRENRHESVIVGDPRG